MKQKRNFNPLEKLNHAPKQRRKRGLGAKPLTKHEIEETQKIARSESEAARLLGVCYNTYVKYATMHGVFGKIKNQRGYGIPKAYNLHRGIYNLDALLNGEYPDYPVGKLKQRLLKSDLYEEACSLCGFNERRIVDGKVPLKINFIDGNTKNHKKENIRFLCLNCYFLVVGSDKKSKHYTKKQLDDLDLSMVTLDDLKIDREEISKW